MDTYEKKYNEALKWMRELYPGLHGATKEDAEHFFPELRESEDERVIRTLYYLVRDHDWVNGATKGEALTWLEKEKEQKPNIELIQRSWYMEGYHDREFGKEPMWIIKTGEGGPKHELNPKYGQPLADEQKPAEIDEYEVVKKHITEDSLSSEVNKRLKECGWYVTDEKPAGWSGEDEKQLDDIISIIREAYEHGITISETRHRNAYSWLNNLRPSWKPSDEQMKQLHYALTPGSAFDCDILNELYIQLKKLK